MKCSAVLQIHGIQRNHVSSLKLELYFPHNSLISNSKTECRIKFITNKFITNKFKKILSSGTVTCILEMPYSHSFLLISIWMFPLTFCFHSSSLSLCAILEAFPVKLSLPSQPYTFCFCQTLSLVLIALAFWHVLFPNSVLFLKPFYFPLPHQFLFLIKPGSFYFFFPPPL